MTYYLLVFVAIFLIIITLVTNRKIKNAAIINHRKNHKENVEMKTLAQQFIGKECFVYTIASDTSAEKGVIKKITENGILLDNNGNLQAINLEYVTRIREWPKNAKGKKKMFF